MPLAVWVLSLAPSLVSRVLIALGLAVVTTVGVGEVIDEVKTQMIARFYLLPVDMLDVFLLVGGGQAMGLILGAITTRLFINGASAASTRLGKNPG